MMNQRLVGNAAFLLRMMAFLVVVVIGATLVSTPLIQAFRANLFFNGIIFVVMLIGIADSLRQVISVARAQACLAVLQQEMEGGVVYAERLRALMPGPPLLRPLLRIVSERSRQLSLSASTMRALLDSLHGRMGESRELARYFVGLLVFLGLLGTFWGLLITVRGISEVVLNLGDVGLGNEIFLTLSQDLKAPLMGMGTAFSSSLFGLAGALILGFLDLQAGQAQNRFSTALEEWLAGMTRLTSGDGEGRDTSSSAYLQALLEQTSRGLEELRQLAQDDARERPQILAALNRIHDGQSQNQSGELQEVLVQGLRNVLRALEQLHEEGIVTRERVIGDLREEIRLLTRTIANLAQE